MVCRTGYTGERGYELVPPWERRRAAVGRPARGGEPLGGLPCGLGARDTLRTEMGYPLHGQELSPTITPGAGPGRLGGRLEEGRPSGARTRSSPRRRRAPRGCSGACVAPAGGSRVRTCAVRSAPGRTVGEVTSGTFSPTLRQGIALALLAPSVSEGDEVVVDVRGREVPARVVRPPFVEVGVREA